MSDTGHHRHQGFISLHRLEGFSDAVFAFAVTLLVVSLEVPKSAHELFHLMHGFIAFGVAFVLLMVLWYQYGKFFKRFPLTDLWMISLNTALLFVILLYVYPLNFIFASLFDSWIWRANNDNFSSVSEIRQLMAIYGAGIIAVNFVFFSCINMPGACVRNLISTLNNSMNYSQTWEAISSIWRLPVCQY